MAARVAAGSADSRRLSTQEQWLKAVEPVSLDPEKAVKTEFVHWPPGAEHPVFVIEQTKRPPLVITEPEIKCACGKKLHAVESSLQIEGFVAAVWFKGMCFSCGWQEALLPIAWQRPTEEQIEMVEEIYAMRRSA